MEEEELERLKEIFKPLEEDIGDILKSVFIYGSAVRKSRVEGSDIDVVVLLDDTHSEYSNIMFQITKEKLNDIEKQNSDDYDLHIQPPKKLSHWWNLLIEGEPWALTACRQSQPIFDPSGFMKSMSSVVDRGHPQAIELRSEQLRERAISDVEEGKFKLQKGVIESLSEGMTDAAKSALTFRSGSPVTKNNVIEKFERLEGERSFIDHKQIDFYREVIQLEEKVKKRRKLKDFEVDDYSEDALDFIATMAELFQRESRREHREIAEEALDEMLVLSREILSEHGFETKDMSEDSLIQNFEENIIEEGIMSREYLEMLNKVREHRDHPGLDDREPEDIYKPFTYLRDFQSAVRSQSINNLKHGDSEKTPITPLTDFKDRLLSEKLDIKTIWVLTKQELLDTGSVTSVVIVDSQGTDIDQVKDKAEWYAGEIKSEYGFTIYPDVRKLSEFWEDMQNQEISTISEVRDAIVLHDTEGFIGPIQKLLEQDKLKKTINSLGKNVIDAPKKVLEPTRKAKLEALEKYYSAAIELGQAALLTQGISPPVQKKVADVMRQELSEESTISEEDIETVENTVSYWKDIEYNNIHQIDGSKLDEIESSLVQMSEKVGMMLDNS